MTNAQPGMLATIPRRGRYLHCALHREAKPAPVSRVKCTAQESFDPEAYPHAFDDEPAHRRAQEDWR